MFIDRYNQSQTPLTFFGMDDLLSLFHQSLYVFDQSEMKYEYQVVYIYDTSQHESLSFNFISSIPMTNDVLAQKESHIHPSVGILGYEHAHIRSSCLSSYTNIFPTTFEFECNFCTLDTRCVLRTLILIAEE